MKPIYPEILTPDNTLSVSGVNNGDGTATISIAEGQEFLIQDVKVNTTGRTDLLFTVPIPTTAGQVDIYHLRYSLNGKPINSHTPNKNSFYLINVADANYNPNTVDESDPQFDTQYDDMLVAKIEIDDAGNITITSYINKNEKEIIYYTTAKTSVSMTLTSANTWYDTPLPTFTIPKRGKYILQFSHRAWYSNTSNWCKFRILKNDSELEQIFHANINNGNLEHADHTGAGTLHFHANQGDILKIQAFSDTDNTTLSLSDQNGSTTIILQEV
ncbi:hypothetical protein SAMN06265182_2129 [Persephonella hydrogeniphila]|uniref:Uncharacterized protein n=1 Tax=Persephonella hydrogeniphila TaxID=198703 RepID=A0A285NQU5_9AQUI|nr:hypothetical protein [Persephonella hydrogeniphila]SNZ11882.1 hypothetical protein SAMN06265182_2129 [Persephonella hydrogeniphila]